MENSRETSLGQRVFRFLMKWRVPVTFTVFLLLIAWNLYRGVIPGSPFSPGNPLGIAGTVLLLAGLLLRSWSAGVVHKNLQLATTGPYALTRHPLYIGSTMMGLGAFLIVGYWPNYAVLALFFAAVYLPKILTEDRHVRGLFPEQWEAYARRTALFFPRRMPGLGGVKWSPSQWLHNREYFTFGAGFGVLALFQWLHNFAGGG